MILYRVATEDDLPKLNQICNECFYAKDAEYETLSVCLLAVTDAGQIVGCCGLVMPEESIFKDAELGFTWVHKDFRNKGICTKLLEMVMAGVTGDVYCSAWRMWDNTERAHLHSILTKLWFNLVEQGYIHWSGKHTCKRSTCSYAKACQTEYECWEDLYWRPGTN